MKRYDFNFDWTRTMGSIRFFGPPKGGDPVSLPDDYIINLRRTPDAESGASTGFFPGGRAAYTKKFDTPADWLGKTVLLDIDGAYMNAEVTLNSDLTQLHPYGYTPFMVDMTGRLFADAQNELIITTDSVQPSSRWYSGGGLFREVCVWVGADQFIHPWDVFLVTERVDGGRASIRADIEVTNAAPDSRDLILRMSFAGAGFAEVPVAAAARKTKASLALEIENPRLWSAEEPNLYDVSVELLDGHDVIDAAELKFGIRVIEIDARRGMVVNGRPVKLRGGCVHHDNALIGARANARAEERKVEKLKAAGYNAIRSAHNPPSANMLDACDRLGMYVLNETFDSWRMPKNARDYHLYFEAWWQRDTAAMVLRDRNHPSVYCWSIGNEISEMNGASDGVYWVNAQRAYVRSLDSTRPVTAPVNHLVFPKGQNRGMMMHNMDMKESLRNPTVSDATANGYDYWDAATRDTIAPLDIAGYNYMWPRYAKDREGMPDRVIQGAETHAYHIYDYWKATMDNTNVIGDFTWTATDNLGEGGAGRVMWDLDGGFSGLIGSWPWMSCYQGDLDLDLERRPQSYYRKITWGLDDGIYLFTTHPDRTGKPYYGMGWHWADVRPTWTFGAEYVGQPVQVEAYCDCDEVEFVLNGRSAGKVSVEKHKAFITLPYEQGALEAIAWRGGKPAAKARLATTGAPVKLALEADRCAIAADGMDLSYITVRAVDADGNTVVADGIEISASTQGAGEMIGLGSANPCTEEDYGTGRRNLFAGRALICVRAGREEGRACVRVSADGLEGAEIEVKIG